jgi:hypothetical protein
MDYFQREESLDNVAVLLEVDYVEKKQLLDLYLTRAIRFIKSYCNIAEIPEDLFSTVEDITIFLYRNQGIENIVSEGKGSLSESYRETLPSNIYKTLNEYRRMKFI